MWGPRITSFLLTEIAVRAWNGSATLGSFVRAPRASRSLAHRLKPSPPDSDLLSGTHVVRRFVPADRARPGAESARSLRRRPTEIRRTLRAVRTDPGRSSLPGYKWKPRPPLLYISLPRTELPPQWPPLGAPLLCSLLASPSAASLSSGLRRISSFEALLAVTGGCWGRFEYRGSLCSPRSRLIAHRSSSLPQSRPVPWTTRLRARFSVISPLMCSLLPSLRVAGVNWGSGLTIAPGRFLRQVLRRRTSWRKGERVITVRYKLTATISPMDTGSILKI
jgi:hypothetical protein